MANTFTNVNATKIQSEIVKSLKLALTPLNIFSLSVGSDPMEKNQFINVPLITARTASANVTNFEDGNTSVVAAQVNLNTSLSASFHITAVEASKQDTDYVSKAAAECAYAVGLLAQTTAFNLIVRASYGTSTEAIYASTALDSDALFDIRNTCMNSLKWSKSGKPSLVLDGAYYANLMKDPAVKDKSASGGDTAMSGLVPNHAGFDLYESGVIASATPYGATEYLRGFACLPQAMALAIRPPAQVGAAAYDVNEVIVDPDSGIACNYRQWVNTSSNTLWGTIECLFGGIKVDGNALYRIVSQQSS